MSEAETLRKQLATLARFGGHALRSSNIGELLQEATKLVSDAVEVDLKVGWSDGFKLSGNEQV